MSRTAASTTSSGSSSKLGVFLQNARSRANLSQRDVADALGYRTAQVVSDWERGLRSPPAVILKQLVRLYNVPLEKFFGILLEERTTLLEKKLKKTFGVK